jgi:hypothetical protein
MAPQSSLEQMVYGTKIRLHLEPTVDGLWAKRLAVERSKMGVFLFWVCFVFVFVVLCVVVVFAFFLWIVTAAGLSTGSFPVHLCGSHP